MITAAATIALILIALAVILGVGRAIVQALRGADHRIDTILDEELGRRFDQTVAKRPGGDDQFHTWPSVRTHEEA